MENQQNSLFLPVPSPSQQRLTFCEATPKGLARWIGALPKANLGEMSRQIYSALNELNELTTAPDNRLQLLELLRSEVFSICVRLEVELLQHPLLLDKRAQQISALYQSLQARLAAGYKLIVIQQLQAAGSGHAEARDKTPVATALQRACYSLRTLLLHAGQMHRPPARGLWLELHRMYQLACKVGLQQMPISDAQSASGELSCERTWLCAVLLGCVRTNQIHQEGIAPLLNAFERWSARVKLQAAHAESTLFVVAVQRDAPPRYRSLFEDEDAGSLLGLNLSALVLAIEQELMAEELPTGLCSELLRHLLSDFSAPAERRAQRLPAEGELTLCLGLRALHYFLAGERPFAETLGEKDSQGSAFDAAQEDEPKVDAWGGVLGGVEGLADASGNIAFKPKSTGSTDALEETEDYPLYVEKLHNRSSGGYCINWQREHGAQPQIGELVGIREQGRAGWKVAQVRWIFQEGAAVRVGIERIADTAQPCGLQRQRGSAGKTAPFLRALLLESAKDAPPRLITPSLPFVQGDPVCINIEGDESLAVLERRVSGSLNFNLFAYSALEGETQRGEQAEAGNRAPSAARPGEEHFDTLWDTL